MNVIGLMGFAGSGKGTVGDYLQEKGYYKFSYADTLKDVVSTIFLWPRELLEGDTEPSRAFREKEDRWWSERFGYPVTPRLMLQMMGTEAGREVFHKDIWIHTLERRIRGYPKVVIPDVRFPNEVDFIRRMGGTLIRVTRGRPPEHERGLLEANPYPYDLTDDELSTFMNFQHPYVHPSEWAWLNQEPHFILNNNGTLDDLKQEVENVLTFIEK